MLKRHAIFPPSFHDKLIGKTEQEKESIEKDVTTFRIIQLEQNPVAGTFNLKHLADIHEFIFDDISSYAGSVRSYPLGKGNFSFADKETMQYIFEQEIPKSLATLGEVKNSPKQFVEEMAKLHTSLDEAHPFREGNGRSTRIFLQQLANENGYHFDLTKISCPSQEWVEVCKKAIACQQYNKHYKTPDMADKIAIFQQSITPNTV